MFATQEYASEADSDDGSVLSDLGFSGSAIFLGSTSRWGTAFSDINDAEEEDSTHSRIAQSWTLPWRLELHKFGGSSMSNISNVASIILSQPQRPVAVVVSAMGGVTDALCKTLVLAKKRDSSYLQVLETLVSRHINTIESLVSAEDAQSVCRQILGDAEDLKNVLRAVWLGMAFSGDTAELVTGYGELWSSLILSQYLASHKLGNSVAQMDARDVLTLSEPEADQHHVSAANLQSKNSFSSMSIKIEVNWEASKKKLTKWFDEKLRMQPLEVVIITGYICSQHNGSPGTLKRNGSDFSASIFGALLKAKMVHIWTDVDGVYSADPRVVPDAVRIRRMSYEEASELAYFGGKVLHPSTMAPAMAHSIPVTIRSSFVPEDIGTIISDGKSGDEFDRVTCFSSIASLALVYIDCACSLGINLVETVSNALKSGRIQVVLVTQAAFEHSYRFCIHEEDIEKAQAAIEKALYRELHVGIVKSIRVCKSCSLVAAIGDSIVSTEGTAARFFTALGDAKVNILVIAQGSASRSISVLIESKDTSNAIQALHSAFVNRQSLPDVVLLGDNPELVDHLRSKLNQVQNKLNITTVSSVESLQNLVESGKLPKLRCIIECTGNTPRNSLKCVSKDVVYISPFNSKESDRAIRSHLKMGNFSFSQIDITGKNNTCYQLDLNISGTSGEEIWKSFRRICDGFSIDVSKLSRDDIRPLVSRESIEKSIRFQISSDSPHVQTSLFETTLKADEVSLSLISSSCGSKLQLSCSGSLNYDYESLAKDVATNLHLS